MSISFFCISKEIRIHCIRLVIKKRGSDKSKTLKGWIALVKSDLIKLKSGEENQKIAIRTNENEINTKE